MLASSSIAYLSYYLIDNAPQLWETLYNRVFFGEEPWLFIMLIICYAMSWLIASLQFYLPLKRFGVDIGKSENLALFVAGVMLNYTPFKAGTIYRFDYMKERYGVSYSKFAGLQVTRILGTIGVSGMVGSLAIVAIYISGKFIPLELIIIVAALLLIAFTPFHLMKYKGNIRLGIFSTPIDELLDALENLKNDSKQAAQFLLLIGLQLFVLILQYWLVFKIANIEPHVITYFLLIPFIAVLGMISLSPGNLGIREVVTASTMSLSNGTFELGMLVGVVERSVLLAATLIFGMCSLAYLTYLKRLGKQG